MGHKNVKAMAVAEAINDLSFGQNSKNGGKPPGSFSQLKAAVF
jgi:hypothetical protein